MFLFAPLIAGAAQQAPRCSDVFDDAQRLACYDAVFGKPTRSSPAAGIAAPVAAAPVVAVPVPAATAAAPPASSGSPSTASASVVGNVSAVRWLADERFVVTLDNGQVWEQLERDRSAEVKAGDRVTVRGAMLGSFVLVTAGKVQTKVKRRQ